MENSNYNPDHKPTYRDMIAQIIKIGDRGMIKNLITSTTIKDYNNQIRCVIFFFKTRDYLSCFDCMEKWRIVATKPLIFDKVYNHILKYDSYRLINYFFNMNYMPKNADLVLRYIFNIDIELGISFIKYLNKLKVGVNILIYNLLLEIYQYPAAILSMLAESVDMPDEDTYNILMKLMDDEKITVKDFQRLIDRINTRHFEDLDKLW